MNSSEFPESLDKHFENVTPTAIPPVKLSAIQGITPEQIKESLTAFWNLRDNNLQTAFKMGQLIATNKQNLSLQTVLIDLSNLIKESIKFSDSLSGKSSEQLKNNFTLIEAALKVLGDSASKSVLNKSENSVDSMVLLSILSGYIASKVYGT